MDPNNAPAQDAPAQTSAEPTTAPATAPDDSAKFRAVMEQLASSGPKSADSDTTAQDVDANPAAEPAEPVIQTADPADTGTADNPFDGLEQEELQLLMGKFKEFLSASGSPSQSEPVPQPDPEAAAQAQAQQQQQAQQAPQQANPAKFGTYNPITDEELYDPEKFNSWVQDALAHERGQAIQATWQALIPAVGLMVETATAALFAETQNPALKGKTNEIAQRIAQMRQKDPGMSLADMIESASQQIMRDAKTIAAVEKVMARGQKLDGRTGTPPAGVPRSVARDPMSGKFQSKNPELSPNGELLMRLMASSRR